MREIKMIVTDWDGTFYVPRSDENAKWRMENLNALRDARKAGILVYPCTGRPWPQMPKMIDPIEFDDLCIACNGASIIKTDSASTHYQKCLSNDMASALFNIAKRYNILLMICSSRYIGFFLPEGNDGGLFLKNHRAMTDTEKYPFHIFHTVDDMNRICGNSSELLRFILKPEDFPVSMRKELDTLADVEYAWSWATNFDAMAKGANKGSAVVLLAEMKGVSLENVMSIGDAENDASMFYVTGLSVAMGNASPMVKDVADFVTDTAENGGFARAIRKYALREDV